MKTDSAFRVACLGDSHTRGVFGYDWVGKLRRLLEPNGVRVGKFGVNGELACQAAARLGEVKAFEPDLVVILLGSNDVNAVSTEKFTRIYMQGADLPQAPDKRFFIRSMERIVSELRADGDRELVFVTLPLLGEALEHSSNRLVDAYNEALRSLAERLGIEVLDLNGAMKRALQAAGWAAGRPHYDGKWLMKKAMARHYLLFQGWDRVSDAHGLYLLTDTIHLNQRSGALLEALVRQCVRERMQD